MPRSTVSLTWLLCSIFEGRILRRELVQRVGQLLFLAALAQIERHAVHRRRQVDGHDFELVLVMARVQDVVEADIVDLRHGAHVAAARGRNLAQILALYAIDVRELDGLALLADEDLIARLDLALVDSKRRDSANVGVDRQLEHVADEVAVALHLARATVRHELGRIALERVRHELREDPQQLPQPGAGLRGDEAHGDQMAGAQRPLERIVQLLERDVLALLEV